MAEGKRKDAWSHTSALMALIANVNRDPKRGRAFKPADFDPYADKHVGRVVLDKENVSILKTFFTGERQ